MDIVAESADQVFQAVNDQVALRDFVNKAKESYRLKDLKLYKVGSYDAENMIVNGCEPVLLYDGADS